MQGIVNDPNEESAIAELARQASISRIGESDDVAYAISYLAFDESRFMTGSELKIDGGISAMYSTKSVNYLHRQPTVQPIWTAYAGAAPHHD